MLSLSRRASGAAGEGHEAGGGEEESGAGGGPAGGWEDGGHNSQGGAGQAGWGPAEEPGAVGESSPPDKFTEQTFYLLFFKWWAQQVQVKRSHLSRRSNDNLDINGNDTAEYIFRAFEVHRDVWWDVPSPPAGCRVGWVQRQDHCAGGGQEIQRGRSRVMAQQGEFPQQAQHKERPVPVPSRHVNHFIAMDQARWINPRIFMPGCRSGGESDEDKGTAAERQEVWACSGRLLPFPLVLLFLLRQRERPRAQRGEQHPQRRAADAGLEQPPSGGGATHRGREEQAAAGQTEGEMRLSGASWSAFLFRNLQIWDIWISECLLWETLQPSITGISSAGPEFRAGTIPIREQEDPERPAPCQKHPGWPRQVQNPAPDPSGQHQAEDRWVRGLVETLTDPKISPKYLMKALFSDACPRKVWRNCSHTWFTKTQKSICRSVSATFIFTVSGIDWEHFSDAPKHLHCAVPDAGRMRHSTVKARENKTLQF